MAQQSDRGGCCTADQRLLGLWVVPGLIDMHVHLREPGEWVQRRRFVSGCRAAAGQADSLLWPVCPMSTPVNDSAITCRTF